MRRKKEFLLLLGVVITIISFASCSFRSNNIDNSMVINDISENTTYSKIISQGYMGGSLLYNESNTSLGQLCEGVSVAVRLSKAQRYDISDTQSVFREEENSEIYGLLFIESIDKNKISLKTNLYDKKGNIYLKKSITLFKNERIDLNEDGFADIQYSEPKFKRFGYEKAMYLNFLSSQEDLNISMYAVLPEQYPGKTYPNGIIGINNDGKFIVQKYIDSEFSQRSVIKGIYKGDYVIDNSNNKYQMVNSNKYTRHARSVNDEDLIDLEAEIDFENTIFLFTEEDFAFSSAEDLLNVLPQELVKKYPEFSNIEKLNKLLEDKELIKMVDENQGSILPEEEKEEILSQFDLLTIEEIIQLNRVFLEKNYPLICPQRVTVSTVITEVLPLASVVFTELDVYDTEINGSENRAASATASFSNCKTENDYKTRLKSLQDDFNTYKKLFSKSNFNVPIYKDDSITSTLTLNNSEISVGIKGDFVAVWGSIRSSLSAAAFFKVNADVNVNYIGNHTNDSLSINYEGNKTDSQVRNKKIKIPIIKKDLTLYEYERCQTSNLVNFAVGPILVGVNLDLGIGLPIKTSFEMDCEMSYSAYIAGLAKASVSAGVDYGIKWKKKWFIKIPNPYINWLGDAIASADAIGYFDKKFESLDFELSKLACQFSLEPNIKAGLSMSVAALIHAGCGIQFGAKGYINFGYYNPNLKASYGLKDTSSIYANVSLGLKGIKILGITIKDIDKKWNWDLLEHNRDIIPETILFEYNINN